MSGKKDENEREENKMETRKCKVFVGRSLVEDEENPCLVRDGEPIYEDAVFHCWTQRAELTDASPGVFVATKGIVEYVDTGRVAVVDPERITFEKKVNYDKKPDGWQDL